MEGLSKHIEESSDCRTDRHIHDQAAAFASHYQRQRHRDGKQRQDRPSDPRMQRDTLANNGNGASGWVANAINQVHR